MAVAVAVAANIVTPAAVWHPPSGFMARFHARCDGRRGAVFDACFAGEMARAGASTAALAFTHSLGNEAYLRALDPTGGQVAIAHAVYSFRANENDAWLLVNGAPPLIDVDDPHYLSLVQMRAVPTYEEIRRRYPNVSFWPGDRGTSGPQIAQHGREIIVGYVLRDLCHACTIVGRVRFAFDFDARGKFLGTRLVSISPSSGEN